MDAWASFGHSSCDLVACCDLVTRSVCSARGAGCVLARVGPAVVGTVHPKCSRSLKSSIESVSKRMKFMASKNGRCFALLGRRCSMALTALTSRELLSESSIASLKYCPIVRLNLSAAALHCG